MSNDFASKLDLAKNKLVLLDPFFASIALRLEWRIDETGAIPTAGTDGREIAFNPEWCGKLTTPQLMGVVRHEVMHVVFKDHLRRMNRNPMGWNIACDHRINLALTEHNDPKLPRVELPTPNCCDTKYSGMEAEQIYRLLPKSQQQGGGQGNAGFPGDIGGVSDAPGMDESSREIAAHEIDAMVMQAATAAKMAGAGSPMIDRIIGALRKGVVDYRAALANLFHSVCRDDYSWSKANRAHLWRGVVLPTLSVPSPPIVGVFIDTSGSIGEAELTAFISEIEWLVSSTGARVLVGSADDRLHGEPEEFGRESLPIAYKPKGGGGTDFRPAFAWVDKNRPDLAAVVYLTDMYGEFPKTAPHYPVLWVATSNVAAPWGMTARIRVD